MAMEYYSFETVLDELRMDEDELKRLVSEGQIRAFRDQNRMRFRRDDIDSLRAGKRTEPTIILPEGSLDEGADELQVVEAETEDTLLDLGGLDVGGDFVDDHSSVPSLDFSEPEGGGAETLTEELVFEESEDFGLAGDDAAMTDVAGAATQRLDEGAGLIDDEFGMQTEPLDVLDTHEDDFALADEEATMVGEDFEATVVDQDFEATEVRDEEDDFEPTVVDARAGRRARPKPRRAPAPVAPPADAPSVGLLWVILLFIVSLVYSFSALVFYDYSTDSTTPVSEAVGKFVSENKMFFEQSWRAVKDLPKPIEEPDVLKLSPEQPVDAGAGADDGPGLGDEGGGLGDE